MKYIFLILGQGLMLCGCLAYWAGCVTAPENLSDRSPVEVPMSFAGEASPVSRGASWIGDFDCPSLSHAIDQALEHNLDLMAAVARLEKARALAAIAGADLYPQVSGRYNPSRTKRNSAALGFGPGVSYATTQSLSLDVSWEIDIWGKVRAGQSAAIADFQVSEAVLDGAKLSLVASIAKAWFAISESALQMNLARETLTNYESALNVVQEGYERGVTPALDLRLTRAQVENAAARVESIERQSDALIRSLEVLLGQYPEGVLQTGTHLPMLSTEIPAGLPSELLERRPDLIQAERRLAASDKRLIAAKRALLPSLSLTASAGVSSRELSDFTDSDFSIWNLAGNLVQPIFAGKRLSAGVKRAKAEMQEQVAAYGQSVLNAFQEIETALAAEQFLRKQIVHLESAASESEASEALAWDAYQRGLSNIITVLEAQRRSFTAQSELLGVRLAHLQNRVDLYLALGGEFGQIEEAL